MIKFMLFTIKNHDGSIAEMELPHNDIMNKMVLNKYNVINMKETIYWDVTINKAVGSRVDKFMCPDRGGQVATKKLLEQVFGQGKVEVS